MRHVHTSWFMPAARWRACSIADHSHFPGLSRLTCGTAHRTSGLPFAGVNTSVRNYAGGSVCIGPSAYRAWAGRCAQGAPDCLSVCECPGVRQRGPMRFFTKSDDGSYGEVSLAMIKKARCSPPPSDPSRAPSRRRCHPHASAPSTGTEQLRMHLSPLLSRVRGVSLSSRAVHPLASPW